jgi:hypothetical protein
MQVTGMGSYIPIRYGHGDNDCHSPGPVPNFKRSYANIDSGILIKKKYNIVNFFFNGKKHCQF